MSSARSDTAAAAAAAAAATPSSGSSVAAQLKQPPPPPENGSSNINNTGVHNIDIPVGGVGAMRAKPVKPALAHRSKKKSGGSPSGKKLQQKKADRHLKWDEAKIQEHDKERGTRMKIDEPNTPYHQYDSGSETDGSAHSARHNSKTQISWDALTNKLEAHAAVRDAYPPSSPSASSHGGDLSEKDPDEEEDEKGKEMKRMEFQEHRKRHYNEMELLRKFRAQQQHDDDNDDEAAGGKAKKEEENDDDDDDDDDDADDEME